MSKDESINNLLELDNERFVIDEATGLWVKFEIKLVSKSKERPHGIKYSLTLHDRSNTRIMGFDNAHAVEGSAKKSTALQPYDHWHRNANDPPKAYPYANAGKLLEDFWKQVDLIVMKYGV